MKQVIKQKLWKMITKKKNIKILKFIFIRMESSVDSNNEKIENKTFVSDILREM